MKNLFVKPNRPILTKVAKEIPENQINSSETRKIVETMLQVAHGQRKSKKRPIMVGLAAPQIGILKRIILVDIKADGKGPLRPQSVAKGPRSEARRVGGLRVYINPQIIWSSKKEEEWYEGCYSTGRVCGIVKRPVSIKVSGYALKTPGVRSFLPPRWDVAVEDKFTGYVARIFQHEIDHLNGKRFPDLIKDPNKLHWVLKKEFPIYRNKQAWKNWPKKCSFERLRKINVLPPKMYNLHYFCLNFLKSNNCL